MKLITLEEAKKYELTPENHIQNKQKLETFEYKKGIEGIFTGWSSQVFNENGQELLIIIDNDGYWQPYIEYLFILQNVPINCKYNFGYINGTHHNLSPLIKKGLVSASPYIGYTLWIEYENEELIKNK